MKKVVGAMSILKKRLTKEHNAYRKGNKQRPISRSLFGRSFYYSIGNFDFILNNKRSAGMRTRAIGIVSRGDRARRESFASETLCSFIGNFDY